MIATPDHDCKKTPSNTPSNSQKTPSRHENTCQSHHNSSSTKEFAKGSKEFSDRPASNQYFKLKQTDLTKAANFRNNHSLISHPKVGEQPLSRQREKAGQASDNKKNHLAISHQLDYHH